MRGKVKPTIYAELSERDAWRVNTYASCKSMYEESNQRAEQSDLSLGTSEKKNQNGHTV